MVRQTLANYIRLAASKVQKKWMGDANDAWKEVPSEERSVLKKYAGMFLKNLKKESFPEKDKAVLEKHVKGFLGFLRGIEK